MDPVYLTYLSGEWVGSWSHNNIATPLTNADLHRIASIQIPDAYSVDVKMNWLTDGGDGSWSAPLQAQWEQTRGTWHDAQNIKMIAAVYAGQWVEVLERTSFFIDFNGKKEVTPMSRIKAYNPDEWSLPFASQLVTEVDKDNVYGENPKGKVRLPIYFGSRVAWVMDRWLS